MSAPFPEARAFLTARPFAHRGLHGRDRSENGMAAFDAAIEGGFGIECDVRLSRDGVPMVFHDAALARMTGADGRMDARAAAELDALRLPDGGAIPRLSALLARTGQATPLLIELKVDGQHIGPRVGPLCRAVARALEPWAGAPVAIMSFNPRAVRWFARHRPGQARGLVITARDKGRWRGRIERALALWLAKPDFLACDIRDLPSLGRPARRAGLPVLSWTVRTEDERATARAFADQIIFERVDD